MRNSVSPARPVPPVRLSILSATLMLLAGQACGGDGSNNGTGGAGGSGGSGGTGGGGGTGGTPGPSFDRDIQKPIFNALCVDCHFTGNPIDYDFSKPFDPQKGIVGRANSWVSQGSAEPLVVAPGNVANSFLIKKVVETTLDDHVDGNPMPLHLPRLSQAELDAVTKWITDGANNDAYFAANVAPIFGTELTIAPSRAGRCTYCHYPNAPSGMSVLNVFDATIGMVNRTSRYGGKIVVPRDPASSQLLKKLSGATLGAQMPLHRDRLTPAQVETLRQWITSGAPNN
jgi:hypothetical protein